MPIDRRNDTFFWFFVHFLYFLKLYHILSQKRFYDASERTPLSSISSIAGFA